MSSKKPNSGVDDEVVELFEGIELFGGIDTKSSKPLASSTAKAPSKPLDDILAEIENQVTSQQLSRPHTPRMKDSASTATALRGSPAPRSPAPRSPGLQVHEGVSDAAATESMTGSTADFAPTSATPGVARKSSESARSLRVVMTPSATSSELHEPDTRGASAIAASAVAATTAAAATSASSWWGDLLSTASTAMKQAEAVVKDMQQNEEAKRWADQVKGNVDVLRGLGQRAIPTFTNILQTIAPPISVHERLMIHVVHDMVGYPSLDSLVHGVFSRVMSQVEGGDLVVMQRSGHDAFHGPRRHAADSAAGWRDGPWWRQTDAPREIGLIHGLAEGTKLCRVGAEALTAEYFAATGGITAARLRATDAISDANPVRTSDIFLVVQPVCARHDPTLFSSSAVPDHQAGASDQSPDQKQDSPSDDLACFAVLVYDPVHELEYGTVSQAVPARWVRWLDVTPERRASADADSAADSDSGLILAPGNVREIIEASGVDPREWVAEWVEEALSLAVGIVAQRYVARRMGVGEGGLGKGKMRVEDVMLDGAGEAARAGLI